MQNRDFGLGTNGLVFLFRFLPTKDKKNAALLASNWALAFRILLSTMDGDDDFKRFPVTNVKYVNRRFYVFRNKEIINHFETAVSIVKYSKFINFHLLKGNKKTAVMFKAGKSFGAKTLIKNIRTMACKRCTFTSAAWGVKKIASVLKEFAVKMPNLMAVGINACLLSLFFCVA